MKAYCTKCEQETEKVATKDRNSEIVLTCVKGHFIKFPKGTDVNVLLAEHNRVNSPKK